MVKKLIKHSTCRRRVRVEPGVHKKRAGSSIKRWTQTFTKGFIQQAFKRVGVREALRHGAENAPFLQREDALRATTGKAAVVRKVEEEGAVGPPSIREACVAIGKQ